MDILHVSNVYRPAWGTGGTARATTHLAEELAQSGHNITVFTTDRGESRLDVQTDRPVEVNDVRVYYFRNLSNRLAYKTSIAIPYDILTINHEIISSFDLIHIHEHRTLLSAMVAYLARKNSVPYFIQAHGSFGTPHGHSTLKKAFDIGVGNWILSGASGFIAETEFEKKEYVEWGINPADVYTVPSGISKEECLGQSRGPPLWERCGTTPEKPIILFLGRLDEIKGVDLLVESLPLIGDSVDKDVHLAIVGPDRGEEDRLKKIAGKLDCYDQVSFIGPLYEGEKRRAFEDADVNVLPSKYESFGITILEAGLLGTPSAISEKAAIAGLLDQYSAAKVFSRDVESLARSVIALFDEETATHTVSNLNALIDDKFTWEAVSQQMIEIYQQYVFNSRP